VAEKASAAKAPYILAGIMGWPVAHSRSPLIHSHWIAQYGLRGAYVQLPVQTQDLESALRSLPKLGFAGCNLTIPHKVAALTLVDRVESLAQRIGAINTVVVEKDGSLTGKNTDAYGYLHSLREAQASWRADAGPALVVGAGGAARAVVAALLDAGTPEVRICNRSADKAQAIAHDFGAAVLPVPWQARTQALSDIALLVNTTNQGMHGEPALDLPLDALSAQALVSDIIYVPRLTPLLAAAVARGNPVAYGLGMLIHQARPAFEAWFGVLPEATPALLRDVQAAL
jgi:shikimate dehydrogenase